MPAMPHSIRIGRFTYTVTQDAHEWAERSNVGTIRNAEHGGTSHHLLRIFINPADASAQQADTLLHEVIHCLWFVANTTHVNGLRDDQDIEEFVVGHITPWLHMALCDNPDLIDYLRNPERDQTVP